MLRQPGRARQARTAHDERAMRRIEAVSSALEPAKRPRSGGDEQDEEEQERVDRPAEHFAGVEIEARRRLLGADRLPVGKAPALCAPPRLLLEKRVAAPLDPVLTEHRIALQD